MMKSKNAPQTTRQTISKWLPLLLLLSATAVWKGMRFYTDQLLMSGASVFYPIPDIINFHWQNIVFILAGLISMLMFVVTIRKYREEKWGVLRTSIGLLFFLLLGSTSTEPHLLYRQSFVANQHIYHLIESRGSNYFASIVLKCDTEGTMCHYYATPYKSRKECSIHADRGYLRQDKTTKRLQLQGEWKSFEVEAGKEYFNDPTWCEIFRA